MESTRFLKIAPLSLTGEVDIQQPSQQRIEKICYGLSSHKTYLNNLNNGGCVIYVKVSSNKGNFYGKSTQNNDKSSISIHISAVVYVDPKESIVFSFYCVVL